TARRLGQHAAVGRRQPGDEPLLVGGYVSDDVFERPWACKAALRLALRADLREQRVPLRALAAQPVDELALVHGSSVKCTGRYSTILCARAYCGLWRHAHTGCLVAEAPPRPTAR